MHTNARLLAPNCAAAALHDVGRAATGMHPAAWAATDVVVSRPRCAPELLDKQRVCQRAVCKQSPLGGLGALLWGVAVAVLVGYVGEQGA